MRFLLISLFMVPFLLLSTVVKITGPLELFDGSLNTGMNWEGGKKAETVIPVEFSLSDPTKIGKISLISVSKNRFWQIDTVKLFARISEKDNWDEIGSENWYSRSEKSTNDNNCKEYQLDFLIPNKAFRFFKIELKKKHSYLYANLAEIRFAESEFYKDFLILTAWPQLFLPEGGKSIFKGGKQAAGSIYLTAYLFNAEKISNIKLVSDSPNQYFSIPKMAVWGKEKNDAIPIKLFQEEWYKRDDSVGTKDYQRKKFDLLVSGNNKKYTQLIFRLTRPNHWLHMVLNSVCLNFENRITTVLLLKRKAFYENQIAEGAVRLVNLMKNNEKNAILSIFYINDEGSQLELLKKEITISQEEQTIPVSFPVPKSGRYKLFSEIKIDNKKITTISSSLPIEIVKQNSRFFFPIGTCFSGPETGTYGFSVVHRWEAALPSVPSFEKNNDPYAEMLSKGMRLSTCINHVPWDDFSKKGIASEDLKMKTMDGKNGRFLSFHLPGKKLKQDFIEAAKQWDGHPGFFQYVYNNEVCYVSWLAGNFVDYNRYALADYAMYLKEIYQDIGALNKCYGSCFKDFSEVSPPKEFKKAGAEWIDWMNFRVKANADYAHACYRALKKVFPQTCITPKPISSNEDYFAASKAIDPWLWRGAYDVWGFDLYPWHRDGFYSTAMSMDFHRTQVSGDIHCTESGLSYSKPFVTDRNEKDFNVTYWPAFLRGLKACYWFEWYVPWERKQCGYWLSLPDGTLTQLGQEAARLNKEVQSLAPILNSGNVKAARIAILWSWTDIMQTPNVSVVNAARGAYKIFLQAHYLVDMISEHNINNGELQRYQVLVLPWAKHLNSQTCVEIEKFVREGGVLIADMQAGVYDMHHREQNGLDSVLGIEKRSTLLKDRYFSIGEKSYKISKIKTDLSSFSGNMAIAPEYNSENIEVLSDTYVIGSYSDGFPAVIKKNSGKGVSYYFSNAWFVSNRNFFYTRSSNPYPASRVSEIANQIPVENLELIRDILHKCGIEPDLTLPTTLDSWLDDERRFILYSALESPYGDLYGFSNWGPRPMHLLPVEFSCRNKYKRLYAIDTANETRTEIAFTQKDGLLKTVIPNLESTTLLLAEREQLPLFAKGVYDFANNSVNITLTNGMNEATEGFVEIKVDGIIDALSKPAAFKIQPHSKIELILPIKPLEMVDRIYKNGLPRPWYVWVFYDGNARTFARIKIDF